MAANIRLCPRCGVEPLAPKKKYCHGCKKGFEYHGHTPKKLKCVKCDNWRVPGTGQKYCADHKLTRNGGSQGPMAQQAAKYNIKIQDLEVMIEAQGGRCSICGNVDPNGKALSVDHDHLCCPGTTSCGSCVRGLLCSLCNRAIGLMRDNPQYLRSAAEYLEKY